MKAQNLNEIRYIITLSHHNLLPKTYYYVDSWPEPELAKLAVDENSFMQVHDSIYFSTMITDAKTYTTITDARACANLMQDYSPIWTSQLQAVSAKVFFKARLMG